MGLFREKLAVEAAMRLTLGAAVKRDPRHALSTVAGEGAVSPGRLERIATALLPFEIAVWHQLWMDSANAAVPPDELSRRFMISLALALRDAALPENEAEPLLNALSNSLVEYIQYVGAQPADRVVENGPYPFLCHHFTALVMGDADVLNTDIQREHFQVFDIAKQSYQAAAAVHSDLSKRYRIVAT